MLEKHSDRRVAGGRVCIGAIALALTAMLLPGCSDDWVDALGIGTQSNATLEEVAKNTNALIGKMVTVRGEVEKKVDPHSFTIGDDKLFGGEKILVVDASGKSITVPDNVKLQVTGQVRKFVRADFEKEFNWNLQPNLYVKYEGKPAIVAQSMAQAPDPGQVTNNPSAFYGKTIAVEAEVEDVISPISFTLDEDQLIGGKDLLVLLPHSAVAPGIKENQKVVVTGKLRPFVLGAIAMDYDLKWDWDLQRKLATKYRQKPVLVADKVFLAGE